VTLTNAPTVPAGPVSVATACIVLVIASLCVVVGLIHTARTTSEEAING
jgi:hypothetical protein